MNKILREILNQLPDRWYLDLQYYHCFGQLPNWKSPKTFNEKLQWMKLYDRNPAYVKMVDKYAVKAYVSEKIGAEHVIPTLGVWKTAEEIEWDVLPRQFVLKTTHGGGNNGVVICRDKSTFDIEAAKTKLSEALNHDSFAYGREWPYKHVPRRIIAEKYLEPSSEEKEEGGHNNLLNIEPELRDYKFFCFNGEPKMLFVATERNNPNTETRFDFFDSDYNHLDIVNGHPQASIVPSKPDNYGSMVECARKLSKDFHFVRVDLYSLNQKVYFGELTFFHHSGLVKFEPSKWDELMGSWMQLPTKK